MVVGPSARVDLAVAMPGESPSLGPVAPARPESATILVLEDEEPVRSTLVEALTRAGYEVHWAADGTEGLAKVESGHFDAVTGIVVPADIVARCDEHATPAIATANETAAADDVDASLESSRPANELVSIALADLRSSFEPKVQRLRAEAHLLHAILRCAPTARRPRSMSRSFHC